MPVAVHPEILAARAAMAAATGAFDVMALPPAEGRALIDAAAAVLNDALPEMASVEDRVAPGPGGGIRVRIYTPRAVATRGWVYYLHGGGWFACSVDTHDRMLRLLAEETGAAVFAADYRHAPEHPYPAPLDDAAAAWDWAEAEAAQRGLGTRFAFAGDSAGANMALALAIRLRDAGRAMPATCALLYGCFAPGLDTQSARMFGGGGYGLSRARMEWYWANYLGPAAAAPPPGAAPLNADLSRLPPHFLGIAEADTVADDSRLLRDRLEAAGVSVMLALWPGATHGFLQMSRDVAIARIAIADTARAIRRWIG